MHTFAQYNRIDTADYAQRKEFLNQLKTKNEALIKSLNPDTQEKLEKNWKNSTESFTKILRKRLKTRTIP